MRMCIKETEHVEGKSSLCQCDTFNLFYALLVQIVFINHIRQGSRLNTTDCHQNTVSAQEEPAKK